jgi:CRISPR-associated protein Cas1
LHTADFLGQGDGVFLQKNALRQVLQAYERRLETTIFHPMAQKPLSYRKILELQARQLRKAIEQNHPQLYQPFCVR